jgi:adenylate cyclase
MGIGIHTGDVVVGNIGSHKRTKYGIVGGNVNLTGRIESYTVGGQILISESTRQACGELLRIDHTQQVMLKGVPAPITIYEIGGINGTFTIALPVPPPVELIELRQPIPVAWTMLEEKQVGVAALPGQIIKMSAMLAHIQSVRICGKLTNLKLAVFDGQRVCITEDLYAKVTAVLSETPPIFVVHFTSVPPEAVRFFKQASSSLP